MTCPYSICNYTVAEVSSMYSCPELGAGHIKFNGITVHAEGMLKALPMRSEIFSCLFRYHHFCKLKLLLNVLQSE